MSNVKLYVGNDLLIELGGLKNKATGAFINTAIVSVTVLDRAGAEVSGQAWPLAVPYVSASDGVYRETLVDTLGIVAGKTYTVQVTADAGDGLRGYWVEEVMAEVRRF